MNKMGKQNERGTGGQMWRSAIKYMLLVMGVLLVVMLVLKIVVATSDKGSGTETTTTEQVSTSTQRDATGAKVMNIDESEFRKLVADYTISTDNYLGTEPCIVDFWAPWCGPCRELGPVIEKVSEETGIQVYKVNVEDNPVVTDAYGIQTIPYLLICFKGKVYLYDRGRDFESLKAAVEGLK